MREFDEDPDYRAMPADELEERAREFERKAGEFPDLEDLGPDLIDVDDGYLENSIDSAVDGPDGI
ncbi:MAG: hypothetical protein ABEK01_00665 [Candidatus Nanohaloarchaea archaeon]